MKKNIQDILIIFCLLTIAFLICMQSHNNIFSSNPILQIDSAVFRHVGWQMTEGAVPYKDIFDHKGLLLYTINYLGALISSDKGFWLIEVAFMFISCIFSYKLANKFTSKLISLFITVISMLTTKNFFQGGNYAEEYAGPFLIISLYIFFDFFFSTEKYSYNLKSQKKDFSIRADYKWFNFLVFASGICFSCVIFLKVNLISVWLIFCPMVLIYCIANKKHQELVKFMISFICGMLVIVIPCIIYLLANNAMEDFINQYIIFNMKYTSSGAIDRVKTFMEYVNSSKIIMLTFVIIGIKIYKQVKEKENCFFNVGYLIYMVITVFLLSISGAAYIHYGIIMASFLIYPLCIMFQFFENDQAKSIGIELIVSAYLLVSNTIPTMNDLFYNSLNYIGTRNEEGIITEETYNIMQYIKENSNEDDLISAFGYGDKCNIYYLTNRKSASKYVYQLPIAKFGNEIIDEYIEDLKNNKAKFIVIDKSYKGYVEYCEEEEKRVRTFVEENYNLVLDGDKTQIYEIK